MDPKVFQSSAPGRLAEIMIGGRKEWAFIPNDLPPEWQMPEALWPLLLEARVLLGRLDGIGQTLPDHELLLQPLKSREAIESSKIEGTFVTAEKLLLFELDPTESDSEREEVADWKEVWNHSRALAHGCEALKELPLCGRLLREMHLLLMDGVRGRDKKPGAYRHLQNQIGAKARYVPPPPDEVERLMANLEQYIHSSDTVVDPLVRCFIAHYQFEAIHPFQDGNGRIGRILLSLMIYQTLSHRLPWLYLSAYFERYREEYIANMFRVSTQGDWTGWLEFCLRGTVAQAEDAIWRCEQFRALLDEYEQMPIDHNARTHQLIRSLFSRPVVQISHIAKQFGVQYNTAQKDVEKLIAAGILELMEIDSPSHKRPKTYYAPRIMQIAYEERP